MTAGRLAPRRRRDTSGDAGTTLIEVLVAMGIMSVLMAVFTASVLLVYRSANGTQARSEVQTQVQLAFQQLDREVRYATGITAPDTSARRGAWYIEFIGPRGDTAQPQCRQLRLDATGVLQLLRWTPGSPPAEGAPGQTLASNVVAPGGTTPPPFERQIAGSRPFASPAPGVPAATTGTDFAPDYQRLRVRLSTRIGTDVTTSDVTFTALNTSRDTGDTNVCSEGRPS